MPLETIIIIALLLICTIMCGVTIMIARHLYGETVELLKALHPTESTHEPRIEPTLHVPRRHFAQRV